MQKFLTNAQMRSADLHTINELGVPSSELMERAGRAIADRAAEAARGGKRVAVVCGAGNNGGDGYVAARLLCGMSIEAVVVDASFGSEYSKDCAEQRAKYRGRYVENLEGADVVIDCIFGTGLSREVSGRHAEIIAAINDSGAYVIAADIPSGINGDNGAVMGAAVMADMTVAIAAYKLGHVLGDGPDHCGVVIRADIGIPCDGDAALACEDEDISPFFPKRLHNTHKGSYGAACLAAGSRPYPGAAALCLASALRSGCGYVKLCTEDCVKDALVAAYPQAIYLADIDFSCQALAIGPGCGDSQKTYEKVRSALNNYGGKLIIDADGINALARYGADILRRAKCGILLTPHVKEFSRLSGLSVAQILSDPVGSAREFAAEYGVTVLLKGAATVITDGKRVVLNLRGSTALAKGGSGDMLTGFICGTAARGVELFDAAVCSNYVLGMAAEQIEAANTAYCATATDIIAELPNAIKNLTRQ